MGIRGCFAAVPPDTLQELREDEDSVEEFLFSEDEDAELEHFLEIDKAWHGIHYLLTGDVDGGEAPYSLAVLGGQEFGPDLDGGPARFLTPEQVAQVARTLADLPAELLEPRFAPQDMERKQIYPDVIWVRDGEESLRYLQYHYRELAAFYRHAAARGDAVIQWLS